MRTALATVLVLLVAPASALAGGFATVGLNSVPEGTAPGEPWVVDLTVLAHGRSEAPVDGLRPSVEVVKSDGSGRRSFPAKATGKTGVYRASVVFESAGRWSYSIDDGYAATHRYPPVQIGGAAATDAAGSGGGPSLLLALVVAGVAGLAAGLVTRLLQRGSSTGGPVRA